MAAPLAQAGCGKLCSVGLALPASIVCSPYEAVLGAAFASLHANVRRAHVAPLRATGTIDVEHGRGWLVRAIIRVMTLPAEGSRQPVWLDVAADGPDLIWTRRIGRSTLHTRHRASGRRLVERSGPGRITFELTADEGALRYRQSSIHVAGIRVPPLVCPRVGAIVSATAEGWRVAVTVAWRGRLVCRYSGTIHPS
jgi:hypothetical protein